MGWQITLTVWLIIQLVFSTTGLPERSRLKGHNDAQLIGAIAGNILKYVGMFGCLYFGGFYE